MENINDYKKLTKTQVKSLLKKGKAFEGFIVGNKVNPYHFFNGWHLAFNAKFESVEDLEKTVSNWNYYNANNETGMYCHYYCK